MTDINLSVIRGQKKLIYMIIIIVGSHQYNYKHFEDYKHVESSPLILQDDRYQFKCRPREREASLSVYYDSVSPMQLKRFESSVALVSVL